MKYVPKNPESVTAWKYEGILDFPLWVARKCRVHGIGKIEASTPSGVMVAEVGDYIVLINEELNAVVVVKGKEFEAEYEPEFQELTHYLLTGDENIGHLLACGLLPLPKCFTTVRENVTCEKCLEAIRKPSAK